MDEWGVIEKAVSAELRRVEESLSLVTLGSNAHKKRDTVNDEETMIPEIRALPQTGNRWGKSDAPHRETDAERTCAGVAHIAGSP